MGNVYVIGGSNLDIQGAPFSGLIMADSNPGVVRCSFGGVGRNIAENLALMKDHVVLVSAMGNDAFGLDMYRYCESVGMDMKYCIQANENTANYLAIMDAKNDMALAICDNRILHCLTPDYMDTVFGSMKEDDIIVLDTNLEEDIIRYILKHANHRIYCDPISTSKAQKILFDMDKLYMLKPNKLEAEMISGILLDDPNDYRKAVQWFRDSGLQQIIISLGKDGVIGADRNRMVHRNHPYMPMKNATGAGDCFVAGFVHGSMENMDLVDSIKFAIASAVVTVQSEFTVSELMSKEKVCEVMDTIDFTIREL